MTDSDYDDRGRFAVTLAAACGKSVVSRTFPVRATDPDQAVDLAHNAADRLPPTDPLSDPFSRRLDRLADSRGRILFQRKGVRR